ncbi:hypothetical protein GCM10023196_070200 [Actinoallomurus vinaceus]|uniref:Uncharacterized protein n=1 Tax=Actinoallomurus vinaceus TaxID=1080074 RepID=A0ABP8UNI9_9ACTN
MAADPLILSPPRRSALGPSDARGGARARIIRRALRRMEPFPFERVYGGWWGRIVSADGAGTVHRSAERYLDHALDDRPE